VKKEEQQISSLSDKFTKDLPKSQGTLVKTLFVIICGIMVKETINLNKVKNQIGTITDKEKTQANSHYRRLTRFFNHPFCRYILWKWILRFIILEVIEHLDKRKLSSYLLMDGTSWEFGKVKYHFLTLSIVYQGVSLPIFFVNLEKKGCSNYQERKRFLEMANLLYPLKGMTLIADREYVGREWFVELVENFELNFVIRLSATDYKSDLEKQGKNYNLLLQKARKGRIIDESLKIGNQTFRIIIIKNINPEKKEDDLVILITNLRLKKKKIVKIYGLRWQIECLFKCLKTNGFNLENLSFRDPAKVRLLICIVIACYVLCVKEGLKQFKKIVINKNTKTKYESIFRFGYSIFCLTCQKVAFLCEWMNHFSIKKIRPKPV
jgi:hypothetical protein